MPAETHTPDPSHDDKRRKPGDRTWQGIASILTGLAAVVVADQTKLTASKLLLGGFYIKDQYREALLYARIALAILGVLLVLLSAAHSAEPAALSSLSAVTGLLLVLTLGGGVLIYAAYKNTRQIAPSGGGASVSSQQASPPPAQATHSPTGLSYCEPPGPSGDYVAATSNADCATARGVEASMVSGPCANKIRCSSSGGFTCDSVLDGVYDQPFSYTHHGVCTDPGGRRIEFDGG